MRQLTWIGLLAVALCVLPCATGSATTDVSAHYVSNGLWGQLTLMGAGGEAFVAIDSAGVPVAQGVAQGDFWSTPVFGASSGALRVRVGDVLLSAVDRDGVWE